MDTHIATMSMPHSHAPRRRFIEPVRYKTRMCRHLETTGHCPYYPRCAFAHGPEDMRSIVVNANQGITHISSLREYQDKLCARQPYAGTTSPVFGGGTLPPPSTTVSLPSPMPPPGMVLEGAGCQCHECVYGPYAPNYYGQRYGGNNLYPPYPTLPHLMTPNGVPPLGYPKILLAP